MENNTLFQKNLNSIKAYDIDLYQELISLPSNDGTLSLNYTNKNEPNLLYKNYPLHSMEGAIDETKKVIKSLNVNENNLNTFIIFGLGFGYLLDEIYTKYSNDFSIIVYEPNIQILRTVLETVDFQNTLNANNVRITTNINMFRNHMLNLCSSQSNLKVAYLESYKQLFTNEMLDFVNQAQTTYKILKFNLNFMANSSIKFFSELIENLDKKIQLPEFAILQNKLADKPAIIVSGGPSLSKNIDIIKKYRDKVCIFAVGTAYKALKRNGIYPDFVNIIEMNDCSEQVLGEDIENINFISEAYTNRRFYDLKFKNHFITFSSENPANLWFEQLISRKKKIKYETKGTVAYNALFCAKIAGCNPIILIGQDLAYTNGKLYADNSPYCEFKCKYDENIKKYSVYINDFEKLKNDLFKYKDISDDKKNSYINYKLNELNRRIITVKGQDGKDLPSDFGFGIFIEYFQDFAYRYGKDKTLKLYNASNGGAEIKGFKNVLLEDILKSFNNNFSLDEIINEVDLKPDVNQEDFYQKIKCEIDILKNVQSKLIETKPIYENYKKEIKRAKILTSNAAKNLKKVLSVIDNIYVNLSSKYKIVLLTCIKNTQKLNDFFKFLEKQELDIKTQKLIIEQIDDFFKEAIPNIEKVLAKLESYLPILTD